MKAILIYPRDAELKLPEGGEVFDAMERWTLDFGINDTFGSVAERWGVRRVVDRVGLRCEAAYSEESLQLACRELPAVRGVGPGDAAPRTTSLEGVPARRPSELRFVGYFLERPGNSRG
ncbi:MAG: hypothetical protein ACYC8T_04960 [Myxococcaceae bacterium]